MLLSLILFRHLHTISWVLAWDGTYLRIAYAMNKTIYELDSTDGTVAFSFSSPGSRPSGDGKKLIVEPIQESNL